MYVITRKEGEEIALLLPDGGMIKIKVLKPDGNRARLGIDAPEEVVISPVVEAFPHCDSCGKAPAFRVGPVTVHCEECKGGEL